MIKKIIKNFYLRSYNIINKKSNKIYSKVRLEVLEDYIIIQKGCEFDNKLKFIGRGTYINKNSMILNCKSIGRYCSISHNVKIGVGSHPTNWVSTSPIFYSPHRGIVKKSIYNNEIEDKSIIIKNDVWIGCNVIIMPGVVIGDGAIIAAGSIVTKNVPNYAIVAGIPAKLKRYRFSKDEIQKLEESKWWDIDMCTLKNSSKYINNIPKFIGTLTESI